MTFSQLHECLRLELVRRIQRGTLTVSLLSRQTGLAQAHVSNFLLGKRGLSRNSMDRVLHAQRLEVDDLLPYRETRDAKIFSVGDIAVIPVVSYATAATVPILHRSDALEGMPLSAATLKSMRARAPNRRLSWERFVAVRVLGADALPMHPLIVPRTLVLIDRLDTLPDRHRSRKPKLFAVRRGGGLAFRYAEFQADRLILRPHNLAFPVDVLAFDEDTRNTIIVGRVAIVLNEL
ncbi:MAG: hypothetical protein WCC26_05535 [Terracidiphilus sp.]